MEHGAKDFREQTATSSTEVTEGPGVDWTESFPSPLQAVRKLRGRERKLQQKEYKMLQACIPTELYAMLKTRCMLEDTNLSDVVADLCYQWLGHWTSPYVPQECSHNLDKAMTRHDEHGRVNPAKRASVQNWLQRRVGKLSLRWRNNGNTTVSRVQDRGRAQR